MGRWFDNGKRKTKAQAIRDEFQSGRCNTGNETLPVSAMLSSIEMQINILQERGVEIRDWENKDRVLKQVRILGGKAYFLAEDKPRD